MNIINKKIVSIIIMWQQKKNHMIESIVRELLNKAPVLRKKEEKPINRLKDNFYYNLDFNLKIKGIENITTISDIFQNLRWNYHNFLTYYKELYRLRNQGFRLEQKKIPKILCTDKEFLRALELNNIVTEQKIRLHKDNLVKIDFGGDIYYPYFILSIGQKDLNRRKVNVFISGTKHKYFLFRS